MSPSLNFCFILGYPRLVICVDNPNHDIWNVWLPTPLKGVSVALGTKLTWPEIEFQIGLHVHLFYFNIWSVWFLLFRQLYLKYWNIQRSFQELWKDFDKRSIEPLKLNSFDKSKSDQKPIYKLIIISFTRNTIISRFNKKSSYLNERNSCL